MGSSFSVILEHAFFNILASVIIDQKLNVNALEKPFFVKKLLNIYLALGVILLSSILIF
ncbi:hypothetical protein NTGM5_10155 [Candidatus Nitrotoga sp. M5]|nr:hypothetical protein NTGM5_10155 [Candidatus Nitrotoga sp. M5]